MRCGTGYINRENAVSQRGSANALRRARVLAADERLPAAALGSGRFDSCFRCRSDRRLLKEMQLAARENAGGFAGAASDKL